MSEPSGTGASPAVWEDLVINLRWSKAEYVKHVIGVLEQGVLTG